MNDQPFFPITPPDPLSTAWLDTSDWGNAKRLVAIAMGRLKWVIEPECWAWYDGRRWSIDRGDIEAQRMAHAVIAHIDAEATALAAICGNSAKLAEALGWECSEEMAQERVKALRGHAVRSGSAGMTSGMLKQARSFLAVSIDEFDRDPLTYNVLNGTIRFVSPAPGRTEMRSGSTNVSPSGASMPGAGHGSAKSGGNEGQPARRHGTASRSDISTGGTKNTKWTVKFTPHDPADMLMQIANVEYQPKAKCPFWTDRLAMLTPDPEQIAAFKPLYGYTLTGLTSDQAFYVHQGKGGDGKSVTHMALGDLHGDYYRHAGVKTFLQGRDGGGSEHRSDLVRLRGDIRFVTCDEPKPRSVWDGETIKQWTGGKVTARGAHERTEVTFPPRGKLHAECNIIPRAPSDDKGFRRRFKLYQWRVSLEDTADGAMPIDVVLARLEAERPGILNWLIEGALEWLETRRIPQPRAMADVLADFWADSSPLLEWIAQRCDTSEATAKGFVKELYDDFKAWCEDQGIENVMGKTAFGRALRDKQFRVDKDHRGVRFRWGISLLPAGLVRDAGAATGRAAPDDRPSPPQAGRSPRPSGDNPDDDFDPFGDG